MLRFTLAAIVVLSATFARAQFQQPLITTRPGETVVQRWKIGVKVTLPAGGMKNLTATTPVPSDWPEQKVRIVSDDLSPGAKVSYQMIEDAARQMTISFPKISAGEELKGLVTFEVTRKLQEKPADTSRFVVPQVKKSDRKLSGYLAPSPYIESASTEIRALARQVGSDQQGAWDRVEAIYRWVRGKVQYKDEPIKGALAALHDGTGDCDEMSSLFIALCRAKAIPARTVRVPGHVYPEFYLLDENGKGRWFPCQAAGTRAFGFMPDPRPVLQRGDKLLVPDPEAGARKKKTVRYLPDTLVGLPGSGGGKLRLKPVCEQVEP